MTLHTTFPQPVPTGLGLEWTDNHRPANDWLNNAAVHNDWASGPGAETVFQSAPTHTSNDSREALCIWLPTFELRLELVRFPEPTKPQSLYSSGESTSYDLAGIRTCPQSWCPTRPARLQAVSLCTSLTLLEPDPSHYDAAATTMIEAQRAWVRLSNPQAAAVFLGMDGLERLLGPRIDNRSCAQPAFQVYQLP